MWRRPDLGCVQMCGYPIALGIAEVAPLASPVPAAPWAGGKAVYRSDLIVRKDAPYTTLADTFGGAVGWTVEHSHSGFNALRHHLLPWREGGRSSFTGNPSAISSRRGASSTACWTAASTSGRWTPTGTC